LQRQTPGKETAMLERKSKGDAVRAVQRMLGFLGYRGWRVRNGVREEVPVDDDGVFGAITESAVLAFQTEHGLYADGRVGDTTLEALSRAFAIRHQELTVPGPASAFPPPGAAAPPAGPAHLPPIGILPWERCPADKVGEGYGGVWLRADAAAAYRLVRAEVQRQGALLTSSGGRRDLNAPVGPNQSATSLHYGGRALDLFIFSGMQDARRDAYVVERLGDRRYRVWARCDPARVAVPADLPPATTVKNAVTSANRVKGVSVTDHFIDLTALFASHGYRPIRARPAFEQGGSYLGAEWWHFQWEDGLIPGQTTFGSDLLRAYPRATLEPTPPWRFRDRVWHVGWS
jgi:peptidoglycan hydrolase-like protein with peptidoglycan-binding domain